MTVLRNFLLSKIGPSNCFLLLVRREVMNYIRDNLDTYSSMIKSEVGYASTNDYFSRKLRTDHQVIGLIYLYL